MVPLRHHCITAWSASWGVLQIVDEDFDDIEGFSAAVLANIQKCGTIDIHPDAWGRHDSRGVNTDKPIPEYNFPDHKRKPRKEYVAPARVNPPSITPICRRDLEEKMRFDWAFSQLCGFPHSTPNIAAETAVEFAQFGHANAKTRDITPELWIWRRSRFMAGFR